MDKILDKNAYTPMIRQYLEIKENYPDTIVFYRVGDFYELFFNDAIVGSRELEIVLTGKDAGVEERVPMCGVPFHAVNTYIEKLSEKGYKVAIVEQLEDPATAKTIVKRDVIRIVTPGTNIDENYLSDKTNNYIGEIEKVGNKYVLSYIDLSTGDTYMTTFGLHNQIVISEINKLGIKEIVAAENFNKSLSNILTKIYNILITETSNTKVDNYLNDIYNNINEEYQISAKRLLAYILETQKRVLVHLKPFKFYQAKEYLHLDDKAVKNLELVENLKGDKTKTNLFATLDRCKTAMGSRYLKKNILYPLVKLDEINERLDFIEEFNNHNLIKDDIRNYLYEIYDLERIIGRISFGNPSPKDLLQLKKSLNVLPSLKNDLLKMKTKVATKYAAKIDTFDILYHELDISLNEEAPYLLKDGNVIKPGYSKELDEIRNISTSNKDFLINLEQKERERTGIKGLKVGYNRVFGYYIEITKSYLPQVKDEFGYIRKQTTSNSERYITEELKERETLILRSDETALNLEIELFNKLKNMCKENITKLQDLALTISFIDMISSLSVVAKENNYIRPTFSHYDELDIKDGRHPVIETVSDKEFVPNDLSLYNNEKILLITGPNMSGKSTYMRQNAIIIIMAQMGSFVPASYALIPIFDQIFTRIGSSDDIASGESTFMSEMMEVNVALQNATPNSLIILDEVGRGTATYDGMALAQAIIEYIHDNIGAKTFFSTHYHELTIMDKSLPFLRNVHVEANADRFDETGELIFLHKVLPGPSDQSYGINVASLANIPQDVTLRAQDILNKLEKNSELDTKLLSKDNYVKPKIIDKRNPKEQAIINEIKNIDTDNLKPIDALILINELKEKVDDIDG